MGEVSAAQPTTSHPLILWSSHPSLLHFKEGARAHLSSVPGKLSILVPPTQIDLASSCIKDVHSLDVEEGISFVLKIVTPTPIPQEGELKVKVSNESEYMILLRVLEIAGGEAARVAAIVGKNYVDAFSTGGTVHVTPQNLISLQQLQLMQQCTQRNTQQLQQVQQQRVQIIPHRRPTQDGRKDGQLRSAKEENDGRGRKRNENGLEMAGGIKRKKTHIVQRTVIESTVPLRSALSSSAATPAYIHANSTPEYLAAAAAAGVAPPPSNNTLINAMAASAAAAAAAKSATDVAATQAATPAAPAAPTAPDGEIAPSSSMPALSSSMPALSNSMPVLTRNPAESSDSAAILSSQLPSPQQPMQQLQQQSAAGPFLSWLPPSVGFPGAATPGYYSVTGGGGGWQQQQQLQQPSLLQMLQYQQQPMQQPAMANFLMNAMHGGPGGMPQPLGAQNIAMALGALPGMQYMAPAPLPQLQQLQLPQPPPQPQQGGRNNVEEYRVNSREFEELANKVNSLGAIRGRYLMDILKNIANISGS